MTDSSLTGKVALVTGGAKRLGREIALALAARGCDVFIHYHRSEEAAQQTVADLKELGVRAIAHSADLNDAENSAKELFRVCQQELGPADLLINNASLFEEGRLAESTDEMWERQFAVNLKSPFFLCREFAKQTNPARDPQIVNLCDWRVERPPAGHDIYTLTKAGIHTLTRMLAAELAPAIRVNAISPGAVLPADDNPQDHSSRASETIPLARTGSPADIVRAVIYLCESPFVTGDIVHVTGGEHL